MDKKSSKFFWDKSFLLNNSISSSFLFKIKFNLEAIFCFGYELLLWVNIDFDVLSKKKQKAQILQGNDIILTKEFITPKNYSGKLYLVLKIDRLQDLGGKNWTQTDTEIVSGGYYAVDNEPPKLNDSEIKYSKPVHRKVTPTLNFKATDNLTSESNLRMCISEDTASDNCSKNINEIKKKQNGWVTYDKSKELSVMNNASNGENHNIFVSIGDQPSVTLPSISKVSILILFFLLSIAFLKKSLCVNRRWGKGKSALMGWGVTPPHPIGVRVCKWFIGCSQPFL